jgi:hypothetical protein
MNHDRTPSGTPIWDGDVLYTRGEEQVSRLYARMPTLAFAVQQYNHAVRKATTNPRCPYTRVWIRGHEAEYSYTKEEP